MKYVVRMSEEQRLFIEGLLSETREQFAQSFRQIAASTTQKGCRKFAAYWLTLAELAFRKNVVTDEEGGSHD